MAKIEQYSRLINHSISTSGKVFTVPSSNDHTDETWLATDLYIGELGVNITDDKVFVRTNNGIVQLSTSATASSSGANIFIYDAPNIKIAATYSADAITPNGSYYTDLGSSSLRFKDLYLGGSGTTYTTINTNGGILLKEVTNSILSTNGVSSTNAPIEIHTGSSNVDKTRPLHLNTKRAVVTGSGNSMVSIGSNNVYFNNNSYAVTVGAREATFNNTISDVVYLGRGYGRTSYESNQVTAGGSLALRGISDDGSTQYNRSEWITSQARLRTTNALISDIVTIPWTATASGGEILQYKAYLIGTDIANASLVYSCEISGVYSVDATLTPREIGTPIVLEWSSFTSTQPTVELAGDALGAYIKVKGTSGNTIQWLCSYSYHRLINVI